MSHNPVASPLLLIAMLFFGLSLARLIRDFKNNITPFHFVFILFFFECAIQYFPVVQTGYGELPVVFSLKTEVYIVFASILLFGAQFFAQPGGKFKAHQYKTIGLAPLWIVSLVTLGVMAAIFGVNYMRLGTLPMMTLVPGEDYLGSSEAFLPFFSAFSWGLGRCLTVLSAYLVITNTLPWKTFLTRNCIILVCTFFGVIFNTLDGMRNNAILPVLILFLGATRRFHFPLLKTTAFLFICTGFFCLMGSMRLGERDWKETITISSGNRFVDTIAVWFITYTEPQFQNLDALIDSNPPLSYGLIAASQILPGPLKDLFLEKTTMTVEYMADKNLFVHHGLTYRTIFADIYNDFGYVGSLLVGTLLLAVSAFIYTKSGSSPRMLILYLTIIPGIIFFPLMNYYLSINNLLPLLILLLLRFQKISKPSVRSRQTVALPAQPEEQLLSPLKKTILAKS